MIPQRIKVCVQTNTKVQFLASIPTTITIRQCLPILLSAYQNVIEENYQQGEYNLQSLRADSVKQFTKDSHLIPLKEEVIHVLSDNDKIYLTLEKKNNEQKNVSKKQQLEEKKEAKKNAEKKQEKKQEKTQQKPKDSQPNESKKQKEQKSQKKEEQKEKKVAKKQQPKKKQEQILKKIEIDYTKLIKNLHSSEQKSEKKPDPKPSPKISPVIPKKVAIIEQDSEQSDS